MKQKERQEGRKASKPKNGRCVERSSRTKPDGRFFQTKGAQRGVGFLAGLFSGMFGAGGGSLLVPALRAGGLSQEKAQATALSVMLPLCAGSAAVYGIRNGVSQAALFAAGGAAAGGFLGGWLLGKIPPVWLGRMFAAVTMFAGLKMLLG